MSGRKGEPSAEDMMEAWTHVHLSRRGIVEARCSLIIIGRCGLLLYCKTARGSVFGRLVTRADQHLNWDQYLITKRPKLKKVDHRLNRCSRARHQQAMRPKAFTCHERLSRGLPRLLQSDTALAISMQPAGSNGYLSPGNRSLLRLRW